MNGTRSFFQKHKNLTCALLFAAFMLVQLITLCLANSAGQGLLSAEHQKLPYFLKQVFIITGFLAHVLFCRLLRRKSAYKCVVCSLLAVCAAGAAIMLLAGAGSLFYMAISGVTVLCLGFIGGGVYLKMSDCIASGARAGLCFGVGYTSAIALQYLFQLQWTIVPALLVLLVLSLAVLFLIFLRSGAESPAAPAEEGRRISPATPAFCVVITVAMLAFITYFNVYIHDMQIPYNWPRLLMIPAVMLIGLLGDIKKGRFLPLGALCIAVISLLNTVLVGRETDYLNMCLYYISLSAVVVYYHLTFLRLAHRTRRRALWAIMGRILDSLLVILSFWLDPLRLSPVSVLIIEIAALVTAVVFMAVNGDFIFYSPAAEPSLPEKEEFPADPADREEIDPFVEIEREYGVSPGEMKVLRELVLTEDKQEAIAGRLDISVSTLRHHITSIYRKTDTQSRLALSNLVDSKRKK